MPRESTVGMMYVGTFHRSMDAKNRVTIPSDWHGREGEPLYFLPASSGEFLNVMPEDEFARQEEELRARVPAAQWRTVMRDVFGAARKVEPDKQGRVLVPDEFCKSVGLTTNVTFIGVKNSFEIWDAAKWSNAASTKPALAPEVEEALAALGL